MPKCRNDPSSPCELRSSSQGDRKRCKNVPAHWFGPALKPEHTYTGREPSPTGRGICAAVEPVGLESTGKRWPTRWVVEEGPGGPGSANVWAEVKATTTGGSFRPHDTADERAPVAGDPGSRAFLTVDNGGVPFLVVVAKDTFAVYRPPRFESYADESRAMAAFDAFEYDVMPPSVLTTMYPCMVTQGPYERVFVGHDPELPDDDGMSVLFDAGGGLYVIAARTVTAFYAPSEIVAFEARMGNSRVPASTARDADGRVYLFDIQLGDDDDTSAVVVLTEDRARRTIQRCWARPDRGLDPPPVVDALDTVGAWYDDERLGDGAERIETFVVAASCSAARRECSSCSSCRSCRSCRSS